MQLREADAFLDRLRPSQLAGTLTDGLVSVLGQVLPHDAVVGFVRSIQLQGLLAGTIRTAVFVAVLLAVVGTFERLQGAGVARYRSRVFAQDLLYALFYHGGFYAVFVWAALANAFEGQLGFLRLDLLASLPAPAHWVLYWILGDFIHYWVHRLEHRVTLLWAVHSVHHSQEEMTFISTYRMHPLEQLLNNVVMVVPLMIIGVPTQSWFMLTAVLMAFDAAQHSALDWTYGKAYPVLVSPRFHSLHHSTDPRQYNGNYGKILSVWDYLFGTAVRDARPLRFGVDGLPVPRTIGAQLLAPVRILARHFARVDAASESRSLT